MVKQVFAILSRKHRPDTRLLSACLDGALADDAAAALTAHVATCAACARELAGLQSVRAVLASLPQEEAPRSFRLRAADQAPAPRRQPALSARLLPLLSAGAAVAFVALVAVSVLGGGNGGARDQAATARFAAAATPPATSIVPAAAAQPATSAAQAFAPADRAASPAPAGAAPGNAPAGPETGTSSAAAASTPVTAAAAPTTTTAAAAPTPASRRRQAASGAPSSGWDWAEWSAAAAAVVTIGAGGASVWQWRRRRR
ncbi:MAG: zf-HC2 domain-containing protein [Dehalococcoidia bacterium]|nr:zf-HC2 domain-containing protein [Dehalococcoidia bacterium]